ncbi:hypothetical protein HAX54_016102 [Datura stramonium]|uniref:Uncharacterized protein n=1 Tax=Datura stramonium TaxID=4076 RepID=A0ABS8S1Y8_DATST|nr:hypothetical protein [Datura stramonium]
MAAKSERVVKKRKPKVDRGTHRKLGIDQKVEVPRVIRLCHIQSLMGRPPYKKRKIEGRSGVGERLLPQASAKYIIVYAQ